MTTIINTKIGESKGVARLWLEGQKLSRGGIYTGQKLGLVRSEANRAELREVDDTFQGKTYTVSRRNRRGIEVPLIEVRADELKELFSSERVRVAIREGRILVTTNHLDIKVQERLTSIKQTIKAGEALKICTIFLGGGVLDRAMHEGMLQAGLESFVQIGVEIEPTYLELLRNNPDLWRPESLAVCSDIREMDWRNNTPPCHLLYAALPCTGASLAGRAKGRLSTAEEHEDAGALFVDFLEAVKATNPAVVVIENVPQYQGTASMTVIRSVLVGLGYQLEEAILNGNDYGALERRDRFVMVATTKGMPSFDFDQVQPVRVKEACLNDVLEDLPLDSERWKSYSYLAEKEVRDKAAGKGFMRQLLDGTEPFCGTVGRGYSKARSTEPFIVHPTNPELSRLLTPVEHARVKGIPEEMIAGESDTTAHEILGQSVIYPQFQAIGLALGKYLVALQGLSLPRENVYVAA